MSEQTTRDAVELLVTHAGNVEGSDIWCDNGCPGTRGEFSTLAEHARHQANMLAAAGLLVTPEHDAQVAGAALRDAADLLHAEARWQYERHLGGHAGAQVVSLRVSVLEQVLRDRIDIESAGTVVVPDSHDGREAR